MPQFDKESGLFTPSFFVLFFIFLRMLLNSKQFFGLKNMVRMLTMSCG